MKHKKGVSKKIECNCTLSTNIPDFSPKVCLDSRRHVCDYANNVYIFLPAFFVDALELCLFICFRGLYVSKCACEYVGWWWQMPLAV